MKLVVLKISGADAPTFLQGQLTNDVDLLDDSWQLTGYCTPKGRLIFSGLLWRDQQDFYLLMDSSLQETVVKRLRMYVLRSQVEINAIESAVIPRAQSNLNLHQLEYDGGVYRLGLGGNELQINLLANTGVKEGNEAGVLDALVANGLPIITMPVTEQFVPQMVNFDLLDGVSFKKGCYTGQEIVARMHYLGKLKQRMYRYQIEGEIQAELAGLELVGEKLVYSAGEGNDVNEVSSGQIVMVDHKMTTALAVIRTEYEGQELHTSNHSLRLTPVLVD